MFKGMMPFIIVTVLLTRPQPAQAYLMQMQTYSNMFERADVVVIATAVATEESEENLNVDQPEQVTDLITTVDTEFKVAYVLKGKMDSSTFHFLHLNRKDGNPVPGIFGAVGTFFVDFNSKENKNHSFILFMNKREDGTYCPAWNPMEGSRAIIAVPKDGEL